MLFKISAAVCVFLAIACYLMYSELDKTKAELVTAKIELAQAKETIKVREKEIKATDEVMLQLNADNKLIQGERVKATSTLDSLFNAYIYDPVVLDTGVTGTAIKCSDISVKASSVLPDNKQSPTSWGDTLVPSDVRTFLLQLN